MFLGLRTVVYHAADMDSAKEWFSRLLGQEPYFDEPFYVGYNVGGFELGLHPIETADAAADAPARGGAISYWGVADAHTALAWLLAQGAREHEAMQDVGGDIKIGSVIDPFGNVIGIVENPHFWISSREPG